MAFGRGGGWGRSLAQPAVGWLSPEADGGPVGPDSRVPVAWRGELWLSWRGLDLCPNRSSDPVGVWRFLSQGSCVALDEGPGLDPPNSDHPSDSTRRSGDRPV